MRTYLVSVWMITYNHEKYIIRALESVLAQNTNFDFEIVIGEDCSTDSTREIIKEFENKYPEKIHAIYHDTNVGAIRNAYEFALPSCQGKYIACLEGDDYWTDNSKLQKQVDFLEKHLDFGLVYGNQLILDIEGNFTPEIPPEILTFEDILKKNTIPTATTCFRNSLAKKYMFDINLQEKGWLLGDYPLWIWIYQHSKIKYMNDFFAVYRINEGSATDFNSFKKGELFFLSIIDIKTNFYSYYSGKKTLHYFSEQQYANLFALSIKFRKPFKVAKYFLHDVIKNIKFVGKLIGHKIIN